MPEEQTTTSSEATPGSEPQTGSGSEEGTPQTESKTADSGSAAPEGDNAEGTTSTFEDLKGKKHWETEEDMAKAYSNLEKEKARLANEVGTLRKLRDSQDVAKEIFNEEQSVQPEEEQKQEKTLPAHISEQIARETATIKRELRVRDLLERYPDFAEYTQDIKDLAANNPKLKDPDLLEATYLMARGRKAEVLAAEAAKKEREETVKRINEAEAAGTIEPAHPRRQGRKFSREQIADPAFYEQYREEILLAYKRGDIE